MKKLQMIKTKIIAAALVFALVLSSVAMVAPTANVSADEKKEDKPWYNTEEGAENVNNPRFVSTRSGVWKPQFRF
jgi:hypothetical protein